MSTGKSIDKLFQDKESNFSISPSAEAWNKWEKKLDVAAKPVTRFRDFRYYLSAAASIILGVACILVVSYFLKKDEQNHQLALHASGDYVLEAFIFEEDPNIAAEISFLKEYRAKLAFSVSDGDSRNEFAYIENRKNEATEVQKNIAENFTKSENAISGKKAKPTVKPDDETNDSVEKQKIESDYPKEEKIVSIQNSRKARKSASQAKEEAFDKDGLAGAKDEPVDMREMDEVTGIAASPFADFQWLIGEWTQLIDGKVSKEIWSYDSEIGLIGNAYVLSGKDTLFKENLHIKLDNDEIFLWQQTDTTSGTIPYQLVRTENNEWIFHNNRVPAPNVIVLTQTGQDTYQSELRSYFSSEASNVSLNQRAFLQQRNQVIADRAIRNLQRVNR